MNDLKKTKEVTKNLRALYVEDDSVARSQLQDILKMLFSEIYIAEDGLLGLEIFKKNSTKIDLIITDVQMPRLNGLDMSREIKAINGDQHILVLSAHNDTGYFESAINIGVDGFIIKPIVTDKFLQSIYKAAQAIQNQKLQESYQGEIERRLIERTNELERSLITDEITELYNKTKLNIELSTPGNYTIVLINIDNFDHINSTYGFEIGDKVLFSVARFLESISPPNSKLFRLPSDEMAFLFDNIDINSAESFAEMVIADISKNSIQIDDVEIHITCTIGITQGRGREMLLDAHIAMKEIREIGKNRYHIYDATKSSLQVKQKSNIEWFKKVKKALENDLVVPYFQPIVNNQNGLVEKYECLARIIDVNRIITPNYFIDPARLVGMLPNITKVMIKKCCEVFGAREDEFSINITEHDLKDGYLIEYLQEHLNKNSISPNRLVLEILENISAQGSEDALKQLIDLKNLGIKIALDDFGSEKSNFYRLQELNVDYLKIDGSFIKNIDTNENCYKIAKTIKHMADSLNAKVIAEFVCNESVYNKIMELGIEYSQGYYFGKPLESTL